MEKHVVEYELRQNVNYPKCTNHAVDLCLGRQKPSCRHYDVYTLRCFNRDVIHVM